MKAAVPDVATAAPRSSELFALADADRELDAALATARRVRGWTFVSVPAPVVAAPALVAAARTPSLVSWSSQALTLVGIGAACELRGSGSTRWREVIEGARTLECGAVIASAERASLVTPRLLGGVAFAPGAAAEPPWIGFGDAWFVLPRWTYVHDGVRAALVLAVDATDAQHAARWHGELAALRAALASSFVSRPQPPLTSIDPGDREAWRRQVRAITDAIASGEYAKIVAARSAVVALAGEARPADMLAELDARHAECVRLLVRPPGAGTLIAATPERLVRRDGASVACDALAGSSARGSSRADTAPLTGADDSAFDLLASSKDRREHELVVAAIASALRDVGAHVDVPGAPRIRTLRHVHHLHTPITATLAEPRHVLELAAALHPTPAVGGTPTRTAIDWITRHESVPRGWYGAPVGWFDLDGNGELAVAIRSGVLSGDRAHLWAGAGIVAGSDPDRELAETDLKLRAMLGGLGVRA
jgi:isochorismate synthase